MIVTFFIGNCTHVLNVYMASFGGDLLKSLNIRLLFGKRLFGWRRQVVWGFRGLSCLTKLCLGMWLWCFGNEVAHLWRHVIATKYGEARGGWCTRVVRGMHGCGMWKNIRKGVESFFGHVVYVVREGIRIQFWYDPRSSPFSLKDLYLDLFACDVV